MEHPNDLNDVAINPVVRHVIRNVQRSITDANVTAGCAKMRITCKLI